MPKIDLALIPQTNRTGYPDCYRAEVDGRLYRRLSPAAGLEDFGVSHVTLLPGAWSSHRHWHEGEDEFLVLLSGEAVLIDDGGRTPIRPGDCVAFPKNDGNGHHLVNEGSAPVVFIAVGRVPDSICHYPDIDMQFHGQAQGFFRKDGSAFD